MSQRLGWGDPAPPIPSDVNAHIFARDLTNALDVARIPFQNGNLLDCSLTLRVLDVALSLKYGPQWHRRLDAIVILGTHPTKEHP